MNHEKNVDRPDRNWDLETLQKYTLKRVEAISGFGRKTVVETWLFGEALDIIRQRLKEEGGWMQWVKAQPFSLTSATNAIKLYQRIEYESLVECQGMTLTDLKAALDIIQTPPAKARKQRADARTTSTPPQTADLAVRPDSSQPVPPPHHHQVDSAANGEVPHGDVADAGRAHDRLGFGLCVPPAAEAPEVGARLTAAEHLGQALNLIIHAEELGVTSDCRGVLAEIADKAAELSRSL